MSQAINSLFNNGGLAWFGLVLWHINHCRLFNTKSIFIHINSSISKIQFSPSTVFCLHSVDVKTLLFQAIQFRIRAYFNSIWPIDRILSCATTLGQTESGSDGNESVLCIPLSSWITRASPSDCLMSYPGHSLGGFLLLCKDAVGVFYSPTRLSHQQYRI